ncbi:mannan polymerase II complex Anp1p subunit [Monosporozyma unispora]|nr:Mannan polymerase II complex anp1 subunit [Kazachstania unispora]
MLSKFRNSKVKLPWIIGSITIISIWIILVWIHGISMLTPWGLAYGIISSLTHTRRHYVPNFNHIEGVEFYDLNNYIGHANGWQRKDRILFCVPLRDAAEHLPRFFKHLNEMTYPHNLVDLSFLVSDSSDDTMNTLLTNLQQAQSQENKLMRFGNIEIFEKDFGQIIGQSFSDRHGFAAQGPRRKLMARARNWLGSVAIKPYHSWVYWRDVDVETIPTTIMEDLMHHDKDVIVPNVWRPLPDWLGNIQPYDLNSWVESDAGLALADTLDDDAVIVEGYPEYATWRPHLAYMRDPNGDPEVEMHLDGIGGVSILSKAKVFRSGSHFPAFSFEKHAETEAFGKLSRRMGYDVIGLPHYVIWHIYEPSTEDLKHMAWMAEEEKRKVEEGKIKEFYKRVWELGFEDMRDDWEQERDSILLNIDYTILENNKHGKIVVDWSDDGDDSDIVEAEVTDQQPIQADFDPNKN